MDEVLFGVLAEYVGRYLDAVEQLAVESAVGTRRLAAAWRELLHRHRPAGRGGCTGCGRRRSPGVGLMPGSRRDHGSWCGVWRVASSYFVYPPALDEDSYDPFVPGDVEPFDAAEEWPGEPAQSRQLDAMGTGSFETDEYDQQS